VKLLFLLSLVHLVIILPSVSQNEEKVSVILKVQNSRGSSPEEGMQRIWEFRWFGCYGRQTTRAKYEWSMY